jgi:hypothetical protein
MPDVIELTRDRDPEWTLIEAIVLDGVCRTSPTIEEIVAAHDIGWGRVIEYALLHKIMPMVSKAMASRFHIPSINTRYHHMPNFVGGHFASAWLANRHKVRVFRQAVAPIITALDQQGIPYVCTKGFVFEHTIYGGDGSRNFDTDVDFLVHPDASGEVERTLKGLRYQQGFADPIKGEIHPHARKDVMTYALHRDHLLPFVLSTGDKVFPYVYVDVACSFTWAGDSNSLDIGDALARRSLVTLPALGDAAIDAYRFAPTEELIFTALHLFREAWFDRWARIQQDVNMMKFSDVLRVFDANRAHYVCGDFRRHLEGSGILRPFAWVMTHLDRSLGTDLCGDMMLTGVVDEPYLHSAHDPARGTRRWRGTMRDRLWNPARQDFFVDVDELMVLAS